MNTSNSLFVLAICNFGSYIFDKIFITHSPKSHAQYCAKCDYLSENQPSLHLPVFQEIPF